MNLEGVGISMGYRGSGDAHPDAWSLFVFAFGERINKWGAARRIPFRKSCSKRWGAVPLQCPAHAATRSFCSAKFWFEPSQHLPLL